MKGRFCPIRRKKCSNIVTTQFASENGGILLTIKRTEITQLGARKEGTGCKVDVNELRTRISRLHVPGLKVQCQKSTTTLNCRALIGVIF